MARKRTGDATYHSPTSRGSQNSCREPLGHTGATVTSNPTTLSGTWCVPRRSPPPSPIMRKRRVVCVSDKLWRGRGERYDCDSVYIDERGRTLKASAMVHRCPSTTSSKVSQHMYLQRRPQHQVSLDNINILDWTRILWNRGERNSVHQAAKTWPERRWGLFLPPPRVESIKQVMTWRSNHQCRSSEEDQVNWSKDRVSFHLHNYITLSTNFTVHCQIKFGQVSHEQKVTDFTRLNSACVIPILMCSPRHVNFSFQCMCSSRAPQSRYTSITRCPGHRWSLLCGFPTPLKVDNTQTGRRTLSSILLILSRWEF